MVSLLVVCVSTNDLKLTLKSSRKGIKYRVREVEDVVYDLSLRNLLPK